MEEGENLEARRLAEQALADAQLAEAQARSEVARQNAEELGASIETLQDELARARSFAMLLRPICNRRNRP